MENYRSNDRPAQVDFYRQQDLTGPLASNPGVETMRTSYVVALSVTAGMVLGAGANQGLRAQINPPAYQISLEEVSNPEAIEREYHPLASAASRKYGSRHLTNAVAVSIDGTQPKNLLVIINQWDSIEQIKAWFNSPEYQKAREIGNKYAKFQIIAVEGLSQQ
jgi:uncharacterized protein (DUF1330 family)